MDKQDRPPFSRLSGIQLTPPFKVTVTLSGGVSRYWRLYALNNWNPVRHPNKTATPSNNHICWMPTNMAKPINTTSLNQMIGIRCLEFITI